MNIWGKPAAGPIAADQASSRPPRTLPMASALLVLAALVMLIGEGLQPRRGLRGRA